MRRGAVYDVDIPSPRNVMAVAKAAGFDVSEITAEAMFEFERIERPTGPLALLFRLPPRLLVLLMWLAPSKTYLLTVG